MAITLPSCPSPVCRLYYLCLKKLNIRRVSIKYPVRNPLLVPSGENKLLTFYWDTLYSRSLVIPQDAHFSLTPRGTYISVQCSAETHISLMLPKVQNKLVIPWDTYKAHIPIKANNFSPQSILNILTVIHRSVKHSHHINSLFNPKQSSYSNLAQGQ